MKPKSRPNRAEHAPKARAEVSTIERLVQMFDASTRLVGSCARLAGALTGLVLMLSSFAAAVAEAIQSSM